MSKSGTPALRALDVEARTRTIYPQPFAQRVAGRAKHALGDAFGLKNFGVNLTRLAPGSQSALRHAHTRQDEFVYALAGEATLVTGAGETVLRAGMCAGFRAGNGDAHHIVNRGTSEFVYLEVGDRTAGDAVDYPDDDLKAVFGEDGKWRMTRKDGSSY